MTNKNNRRIAGQNEVAGIIEKQVATNESYKLTTRTLKTKRRIPRLKAQPEKQLKAAAFVKALNHLLYITYRFTCEKIRTTDAPCGMYCIGFLVCHQTW
jgi:hypothetical protein